MTKPLHKSCVRSADKLRIEKITKLMERVNTMLGPDSKHTMNDVLDETFKFLEQVPDLLSSIKRMEKEYKMAYTVGEAATTLMQKKGRENRNFKYSEQNAQMYYKFIDKLAHLKLFELNQSSMIALRERARSMVDFEGKMPFKQGHWISQSKN